MPIRREKNLLTEARTEVAIKLNCHIVIYEGYERQKSSDDPDWTKALNFYRIIKFL